MTELRLCRKCNRMLPPDGFHKGYTQCKDCVNTHARNYRKKNIGKIRSRRKEIRYEIKQKALIRLGGSDPPRCAVCGFDDDLRFLQVDHINNDGHADRTPRGRRYKGNSLYRKILRMSAKEAKATYQVLCAFHNWARRYGVTGDEYEVIKI